MGDLHRKTVSYALQWRRSPSFFLTCANPFSRKPSSLQSIDCQEILTEPRQNDNAVILPNTLKISNLSCEIFVAEEGS